MKRLFRFKKDRRGFTLLLAALVASIALSLGAAIFSIVSKELELSSIGEDSQYAFYAADTAAECALYWDSRTDIHADTFATSSASVIAHDTASSILCDGQTAPITIASYASTAATSTVGVTNTSYGFDLFTGAASSVNGYCANVTVAKTQNASGAEQTEITANGYSVPCASIDTAPNALQRSVELQY